VHAGRDQEHPYGAFERLDFDVQCDAALLAVGLDLLDEVGERDGRLIGDHALAEVAQDVSEWPHCGGAVFHVRDLPLLLSWLVRLDAVRPARWAGRTAAVYGSNQRWLGLPLQVDRMSCAPFVA